MQEAHSIHGLGRCSGEENGNPLQHSYLKNPMEPDEPDGLQSMVSQKSQTSLST